MRDWRRSPAVAVAVIIVFFAIQLAIPISRMGPPHTPERFGWQMFSRSSPPVTFTVETENRSEEVEIDRYLARDRAEIDATRLIPPHLCNVVEGAVSIVWQDGEYAC